MIRCTIEMIPHGIEDKARKLGIVEIANDGTGDRHTGSYKVCLKKSPPWNGALKAKWKSGVFDDNGEDEDILTGSVEGFSRQKRGPYDLLFKALKSCGLDKR